MISKQVVSLPPIYLVDYDDTAGIDADQAAGDVAMFYIPFKCHVVLPGVVVTEVCAGSSSTPVIAFDEQPVFGVATDRTDSSIASLALETSAAGVSMYDLVAVGETAGILEAGSGVVVEIVTAAVGTPTGHFRPFLIVEYAAETLANCDNMTETA